ncbi:CU044_2847 family protein [Actinomadura sp. 9N215]|uniref:CU044_2847 family protein n=1 Tax=Actinomadura sp. 9N215 TaxID=3375150 RepID=UPI00379A537C
MADEVGARLDRVGLGTRAVHDASETLQDALRRSMPAVQAVLGQMREIAEPPDRVTVKFGIKVTAAAGVVIAQAGSEANFVVSVEWDKTGGNTIR